MHEDGSILLVASTEFEAIGYQPLLTIRIDSIGHDPSSPFGKITSDVAFFLVNSSKTTYIGPDYYETFPVNATVENGVVNYEVDFTNNVEKAKNIIYPQGTVEDCGVKGRMTFEVMIGNSIGVIKQKRFLKVLLRAHADLNVITCDVTLPQTADIKDAKKDDQDMRKITSYRVDTSVTVTPLEHSGADLYLEWDMPEEIHLLTKIISHPIFTLIIGSIGGSIVGRYVLLRISEGRQKKQLVKKLIMELEGIKKDISGRHSITTTIYDSSTSKLLLFSDETAEIVKKTYDEIKRYETPIPFTSDEIEQLLQKINATIDALRREL